MCKKRIEPMEMVTLGFTSVKDDSYNKLITICLGCAESIKKFIYGKG